MNGQQTVVEDDAIRLDSQGEIRKIVNLCTGQLGRADLHAQPFDGHRLGDEHQFSTLHAKMAADVSPGRYESAELDLALNADRVAFKGNARIAQAVDFLDQIGL